MVFFFKSSINPFPPVDKRNIWVRGRLSSSLSYSFPPFPSSSDLCSLSSTSHTSPHFAYKRLELHPSLCLLLSTFLNPKTIPPRLPLSHDLRPPLHIHLYLCLDLHHDVCTPLHLHLCPISFKLPHSFTLHIPLPNDVFPHLHLHIYLHLTPLHLLLTLHIFLPIPLHYSYLNLPHYHLHPNHRSQIIQWLAAIMPLFNVSLL